MIRHFNQSDHLIYHTKGLTNDEAIESNHGERYLYLVSSLSHQGKKRKQMFRLILFIFLIIFILPIDCQNGSTVLQKPSLCINNTYTISLFSTRNFRITFNRTRLRQLNIHTLSLYVSIEDRKVADFQDHRHIMRRIYRLPNDTECK